MASKTKNKTTSTTSDLLGIEVPTVKTSELDTSYKNNLPYQVEKATTSTPTVDTSATSYAANTPTAWKTASVPTTVKSKVGVPSLDTSALTSQIQTVQATSGSSGSGGTVTDEGVIVGNGGTADNETFSKVGTVNTSVAANKTASLTKDASSYAANVGTSQTGTSSNTSATNTSDLDTSYATNAGTSSTTDSSTSSTTTDSSTSSTTTDSDDDYVMSYEEYIESEKERAAQEKADAEKAAEVTRERAIADARSSYAQNLATYGANAESLGSMGLTGSGYGEYLNSQAYAQQRSDIQAANAQEIASKQSAATTYSEYLSQLNASAIEYKETQAENYKSYYSNLLSSASSGTYTAEEIAALASKHGMSEEDSATLQATAQKAQDDKASSYYAEFLNYANSGTYTAEQLKSLGEQHGLTEEQVNNLVNAANTYDEAQAKAEEEAKQSTYDSNYATAIDNINNYGSELDSNYLDNLLELDYISQEQYDNLMAQYQNVVYNEYVEEISSGSMLTTSEVDEAYANGSLNESEYNSIKEKWNANINTDSDAFSDYEYEDGTTLYNYIINSGWATDEVKQAVTKAYTTNYATDIAKKVAASKGLNSSKISSKVVDIYSNGYSDSLWGNAAKGTDQSNLVTAYVNAAKAGKIQVGQICSFNYGLVYGSNYMTYLYIGDGIFVEYKFPNTEGVNESWASKYMYLPDGYKYSGGVRKS